MDESKRDFETNRQINITCIVLLVIMIIIFMFLIIYILFSKSETNKKVNSIKTEIETITFENSEIEDQISEFDDLMADVENSDQYLKNLKLNYRLNLLRIEEYIKKSESKEKIAYLNFVTLNDSNLDRILSILNSNNVLATFYVNSDENCEEIKTNGNLIGLYFDDENKLENAFEDNKTLIDTYDIELYMTEESLNESEHTIPSLKKVIPNSTSEGKKQLNSEAYSDGIIMTSADRDFLLIKMNADNSLAVDSLQTIINGLKDKDYIFLPLISDSTVFE